MAPSSTPWNELLIGELKRLWAEGYSATDIARELRGAVSRNAVIGKVNRLGLSRRKPEQPRPRKPTIKRGRPIVRRPVFIAPPPQQQQQQEQPPPLEPSPRMRRLQLLQLEDNHCRWPYGDPMQRPFYFCASDTTDGQSYCPFHMRLAYTRPRGTT